MYFPPRPAPNQLSNKRWKGGGGAKRDKEIDKTIEVEGTILHTEKACFQLNFGILGEAVGVGVWVAGGVRGSSLASTRSLFPGSLS